MIFISSDKLHRRCAPIFLRPDQQFVWGPELKSELSRVNSDFSKLPAEVLEQGLIKFAKVPTGNESNLLISLWDKYTPGWRKQEVVPISISAEKQKKIVEHLRKLTDAPTDTSRSAESDVDLENVSIERLVPKKKGSWWVLPKDLKHSDD